MNVKRASVSFLVLHHKVIQMHGNLTLEQTDSWTLESIRFGKANNVVKRRWIYHHQVLRALLCLAHFLVNKINSSLNFVIYTASNLSRGRLEFELP